MKAVALLSGGLDSTLSLKLIIDQGISVTAVNFLTPFCLCDGKKGCRKKASRISKSLNIELKIFNISEEYLQVVKAPRYGYGKRLNPCIDCRILMFKKAGEFMKEIGASFLITGEVLGQRPMSQNRQALSIIEREAGLEGLILRPLSAKVLPESIPEKKGWVSREALLEITGRARRTQLELASRYNLKEYACPAGGCLLTDPIFSLKARDLLNSDMFTRENITLIKCGRYFPLNKKVKLVVGRHQAENEKLKTLLKPGDIALETEGKGPFGLVRGEATPEEIEIGARILGYYSKSKGEKIKVSFSSFPFKEKQILFPLKLTEEELEKFKVYPKANK
jgi:tRNA U34 2-thiouridine synthase MnmA/TrmU